MFCLTVPTDAAWAHEAVRDLDRVLVDHAHCEMKAASNALSLAVRHPDDLALVRALSELAREELDHFERVVTYLERRHLSLGAPPVDEYAAALRRAMNLLPRSDEAPSSLVDRLLVSALIEARSCERFKLMLAAMPQETPADFRAFYEELFAAEARHYRAYIDLAITAMRATGKSASEAETYVDERLGAVARAEGEIVARLATGTERATVHG